jgi:hypothetical protein
MSVNRVSQPTAAGKLTGLRSLPVRCVAKVAIPLVVGLVLLAVFASSASAQSPWWHLSSGQRPADSRDTAVSAVQDVTVTGKPGEGFSLILQNKEEGFLGLGSFTVGAELSAVQAGFAAIYGAGNVEVSENTTAKQKVESTYSYLVAFKGALRDESLASVGKLVLLSAFEGKIAVSTVTEGRPEAQIVLLASNLGDATASGAGDPIRLSATLPAGLRAMYIEGFAGEQADTGVGGRGLLKCPRPGEVQAAAPGSPVTCTFEGQLPAYEHIEMVVGVAVESEPAMRAALSVSGGEGFTCKTVGASTGQFFIGCLKEEAGGSFERVSTGPVAPASLLLRPLGFGGVASFGLESYELNNEETGGAADTQAGSHPFQQTTTFSFDQTGEAKPVALVKDLHFKWPAGEIGNPAPLPKCTLVQFSTILNETQAETACPSDTAVGVTMTTVREVGISAGNIQTFVAPLFNLEPLVGEPARLGFYLKGTPVFIDPSVRDGEDYGVTISTDNISQTEAFIAFQATVWGVPGEPVHDSERGYGCLDAARGIHEKAGAHSPETPPCKPQEEAHPTSFLALPTDCAKNSSGEPEPLKTEVDADSWLEPNVTKTLQGEPMKALDGCNKLPFEPSIEVRPDGTAASSASGLTVDVHVPQEDTLNAGGLSEGNPKTITVALPEGVAVNPSGGDGLQACSEGLVGFKDFEELPTETGVNNAIFSPRLPGSFGTEGSEASFQPGVNFCSDAAKIGEAEVRTPILPHPLKGAVYLATQNENPFGALLAMYIVAEDPVSGVTVKLPGAVQLCKSVGEPGRSNDGEPLAGIACAAPGQLIATFEDSPQAPFEDAVLHFFGGARAPLATPAHCGSYTTQAAFTPWSAESNPAHPEAPRMSSSKPFDITEGPNHTPCPGATLPFSPSLTGGATNLNAGSFSPLTGTFGREDGEQSLARATFHLPEGLSGLLSTVKLCPEAQADAGSCGPESLIGETTVSAGVGSDPISVKGGKVYITEKYHGAPFGVSVVDPVKAGPFDLEHDTANPATNMPACDCIVVRGKIEINPYTTALTVTTNSENEGYAIPHFIDGIPVQIRKVNFITTRPGFQFNPTNCNPTQVSATIESAEGATDNVSVPFQVTNCAVLKFAPKFTASTSGKTSRSKGASLSLKVTGPSGPGSGQANFTLAKIELPKQLPSRLTTLQKACTAAQFEANPAGCPAASDIGRVKVSTPLLPVPLEGPAYFVSHGGEAFPSVIFVLQGYGITVDVVSTTFISKSGITSATIKTVPDQPFTSFELSFPEKQYSALAANGNLCKSQGKLKMPTEFKAQNGLELKQNTNITVTGCGKHKKAKKTKKHHKKKPGKGNGKAKK